MKHKVRWRNDRVLASVRKLPKDIKNAVYLLVREILVGGAVRGNWPNYSKLGKKGTHHCHLKKGKPTYVAIWKDEKIGEERIIFFDYVGTHGGVNYDLYK